MMSLLALLTGGPFKKWKKPSLTDRWTGLAYFYIYCHINNVNL
jgi:hypothetical protein